MLSSQNSSFAIVCHILDNLDYVAVYKLTKFTIIANSNNEFQLSILEALLITRHKPDLCLQKQFSILYIFTFQQLHLTT